MTTTTLLWPPEQGSRPGLPATGGGAPLIGAGVLLAAVALRRARR